MGVKCLNPTQINPFVGDLIITGNLEVQNNIIGLLYDHVNGCLAFEFQDTRTMYDTSESPSADFEYRRLVDSNSLESINWENRFLADIGESAVITWASGCAKFSSKANIQAGLEEEGMIAFNFTTHKPCYYNGSSWVDL